MNFKFYRTAAVLSSVVSLFSLAQGAWAGSASSSFTYTNRDLLLGFRKTGSDGTGTVGVSDFEVNIGQASLYYNAAPGSTFTVSAVWHRAELAADFDNLNDLSWSVAGYVPLGDGGDPRKQAKTLWMSAPRTVATTPAAPLLDYSASAQGTTGSKINSALFNAAFYGGTTTALANANNSATVVTVPVASADAEAPQLGANGDFLATFEGDVENTTPANFVSGGAGLAFGPV